MENIKITDMARGKKQYKTEFDAYLAKVIKKDGCWSWSLSSLASGGYGRFWHKGKIYPAHRVSYLLHKGEIPNGMYVCHHCDNPICSNPEHLFLGTPLDNVIDCIKKGRFVTSINHGFPPNKVLTEEKVAIIKKEILENKSTLTAIGIKYGVGRTAIREIKYGRNWKDVPPSS